MKCGVCGSKNLREVFPLNPSQLIYDCQACGVRQLLPQKVSVADYTDEYYDYYGKNLQSEAALERIKLKTYTLLLKELAHYVQPGRLLDIGCGFGHAIKAAQSLGWIVEGTEYSPYARKKAYAYTNAVIYQGDVQDLLSKKEAFDAVTMFDVLEHVPNPMQTLTATADLLKTRGVLLVVTPNVESLSAKIMGQKWNHYHRDHLFYFNPHSITNVMPKVLRVRKVAPTVKLFNLAYIHGYFNEYPTPLFSSLAKLLYAHTSQPIQEFPFALHSGSMMVMAQKRKS